MRVRFRFGLSVVVTGGALTALSCLPKDTRPVPGMLELRVQPATSGTADVTTLDGWTIRYHRLLIAIGRSSLSGNACNEYSSPSYRRILDVHQPATQRVDVIFGRGSCHFEFGLGSPNADSPLGIGVDQNDLNRMRTPDPEAGVDANRGVSVYANGEATNGLVKKVFDLEIRQRVRYENCVPKGNWQIAPAFTLTGNTTLQADVHVYEARLFWDGTDPDHLNLRFEPFASADDRYGNADGTITVDELEHEPLSEIDRGADYLAALQSLKADAGDGADAATESTFAAFVYDALPALLQLGDPESCHAVEQSAGPR